MQGNKENSANNVFNTKWLLMVASEKYAL